MILQGFVGMLTDDYTTEQLENHINIWNWGRRVVSLEERQGNLYWMGKELPVRKVPVYLAADDPRRKAPSRWSEECDDFGREPGAKQVWLPHYCIYRSPQTGGKWRNPCVYGYVTLCDEAPWAELLYLEEQEGYLERYVLTDDPMEEDPNRQAFEYYRRAGALTVTGVKYYCERLHIPARIDGVPVTKVALGISMKLSYLRELVVEEGVQKLDFSFAYSELTEIQLPDTVKLVRSPDGIRYSGWFAKQPDGPVYFHNYYCGTKGEPNTDRLVLREGTVGAIKWADQHQQWRRITLPASLTYLANSSFDTGHHLEQVDFPTGTGALKRYFTSLYPFYANTVSGEFAQKALPGKGPLTGKDLYDLGRDHAAIGEQIPWGWLPTAPRLRYRDGWIAEFWYCAENQHRVGYYAAFRLPVGEAVEVIKLDRYAHASFVGCWTDDYLTPDYLQAEDYLDCCAVILRSGEPTREILDRLEDWWRRLVPRRVLALAENDGAEQEVFE